MPPDKKPLEIVAELSLDPASRQRVEQEIRQTAQQGTAQGDVAGAERAAAEGAQRRLDLLRKQNQAIEAQIALLRRAAGIAPERQPTLPTVLARGRVLARQITSEPLSAQERAAFQEQQLLAASFQRAQERFRLQQTQRQASERFIGQGLGGVFGLPAYALSRGQRGVSGFFAEQAQPRLAAQRLGLSYDQVRQKASAAGLSVEQFIRRKQAGLTVEGANIRALDGLARATGEYDRANRRTHATLGTTLSILRNLATAFVGFQVFRGIQRAITDLIDYQKTLQNVRLGVAEILLVQNRFRDRITGDVLPIGEQLRQSFSLATRASRELVDTAIKFGLPLDTLVRTFQTVGGLAQASGVSFGETLSIITQIGVVAQRLNLPFNQLTRSVDNVFTGLRVQQTQLGVILGLNEQIVQQQIKQGTLGQFLLERLRGVAATLPENLTTLEGITQSLRSLTLDVLQRITGGGLGILQEELRGLRDRLLEIRDTPNRILEIRQRFTELTESVIESGKAFSAFVRENRELLKILLAIYAARRLGPAGLGIAGVATGAVGTAVAGGLAYAGGRALFAGAGGAGSAALSALGIAVGGPTALLLRFATTLGLTIGALELFRAALRRPQPGQPSFAEHLAGRVRQYYTEPAGRLADYFLGADLQPGGARATSEEAQIRAALNAERRLRARLTPQGIAELQEGALRGGAARGQVERRVGIYRDILGERGAIQGGIQAADLLGRAETARRLRASQEELNNLLVDIEAADPIAQYLRVLDDAIKANKDTLELKRRQLAVARAEGEIESARAEAQGNLLRIQLQILGEATRARQIAARREDLEGQLRIARGPRTDAARAEARISALESRINTLGQLEQIAGTLGDVGGQTALSQERFQAEQQIIQQRRVIAEAERAALEEQNAAVGRRIEKEEEEATVHLPARLKLELQILNVQREQAAIRAGTARAELAIISPYLAELRQQKLDVEAQRAASGGDSRFQERSSELAQQIYQARLDETRAAGALVAAQGQQAGIPLERQRIEAASANERAEAENRITQARIDQADVTNDLTKNAQEYAGLNDQIYQSYLQQLAALQQINEQQGNWTANLKHLVADLITAEDSLSNIFKNYSRNLNRVGAERIAGVGVDLIGRLLGGGQANYGGALRAAFNPQLTAQQAQSQYVLDGGGGGAGGFLGGLGGGGGGGLGGLFGGGGGGLGGLFGGGGGAAGAAGGGGGFTAGYGGQSTILGTSAFGGGGLAQGAGGGTGGGGAAGAGAGLYLQLIISAIEGILAANEAYRKIKFDPTLTREQVQGRSLQVGIQAQVKSFLSAFGLGSLAKPLGKLFDIEKHPERTATLSRPTAQGILLNPVGSAIATFAELAKVFQAPTVGPIIAKTIAPILRDIGLVQNVRFGGGRSATATNLIVGGPQGPRFPSPASYTPDVLQRILTLVAPAGSVLGRGAGRADILESLPASIRASLISAGAGLQLAPEDLINLAKQFTQKATGTFQAGAFQILGRVRRQVAPLSQQEAAQQIVSLYDAFNNLPGIIDKAALSLVVFGQDGTASIERLQRAAEDAQTVLGQGISQALIDSVRGRDPLAAAETLATTFTDTFVKRVGERLIQEGSIGKALTQAVALSEQAAEALAAGDRARYTDLLQQARAAFLSGRQVALGAIGQIYGPIVGFENSLGIFGGGGGLINPTGAGLPTFQTSTVRHVPGPDGAPRHAIVHGGEVIREGAHDDALVAAINNLTAVNERVVALMADRMSGDQSVTVKIGDEVIERATARRVRRDGIGRGVRTPSAMVGVA